MNDDSVTKSIKPKVPADSRYSCFGFLLDPEHMKMQPCLIKKRKK